MGSNPNQNIQPIGMVPLYPLPAIVTNGDAQEGTNFNHKQFNGVITFPPIHSNGMVSRHSSPKQRVSTAFVNGMCKKIIDETVEEEVLDILMELLSESTMTDSLSPTFLSNLQKEENLKIKSLHERFSRTVLSEIMDEVVTEECMSVAIDFFDSLILNHRQKNTAIAIMHEMVEEVLNESTIEVATSVINKMTKERNVEVEAHTLLNEVVNDQLTNIVMETLNHYGSRLALIQYRQISQEASKEILDTVCMEALLRQWMFPTEDEYDVDYTPAEIREADHILNQMIFDVLLAQTIALHSCSDAANPPHSKCIPLERYKKKLCLDIAEDIVVDELCKKLDNVMNSKIKNE